MRVVSMPVWLRVGDLSCAESLSFFHCMPKWILIEHCTYIVLFLTYGAGSRDSATSTVAVSSTREHIEYRVSMMGEQL
jgi:hypothetical protein